MKSCLIIFAKTPQLGKVKTRLAQDLPQRLVLKFYKSLLRQVLAMAQKVKCDSRFLFYTGGNSTDEFYGPCRKDFLFRRQQGRDLGKRMTAAFTYAHRQGFTRTIIIGADCPDLRQRDINQAFKKLAEYDIVLGPSFDGGYYLIGLRKPESELFARIPWSTESVLIITLSRARKLKKKVFLLRQRRDIDTFSDFKKFMKTVKTRRTEIAKTINRMKSSSNR